MSFVLSSCFLRLFICVQLDDCHLLYSFLSLLISFGCLWSFIFHFVLSLFLFFFFKQKTAYEMRISDWSSDVCSSDLRHPRQCDHRTLAILDHLGGEAGGRRPSLVGDAQRPLVAPEFQQPVDEGAGAARPVDPLRHRAALELGRASCRESVCQYV